MPKITVTVVPEVVRNKPETERKHVVTGTEKGWEKASLNKDGSEVLTESKGLDALLTKSNLKEDGTTKIDDSKPIGFEVSYDIYDPDAVAVTAVTVIGEATTGTVGDEITLDYDVTPANATYPDVKWSSSDETVATSLGEGKFKLLKAGKFKPRATAIDGGVYGEIEITVEAATVAVTGLKLAPATVELAPGATQQLTATVSPDTATDKTVTYASSDDKVATVDAATGLITVASDAADAATATITGTTKDGAKTATSVVTVKAATA